MLTDLPTLCAAHIIGLLSVQSIFRRPCDIVRDCARLAATSRDVRAYFAVPLGELLNPPTRYEALQEGASVTQLKDLCRDSHLALSGNKAVLCERLRFALEDVRLAHCRMGSRFCAQACATFLEDPFARMRKETALRLLVLKVTLQGRGCRLRSDSMTSAYITGAPLKGLPVSLQQAIDVAEEMRFLYKKTDYRNILSSLRDFDLARMAGLEVDEEARRKSAKRAAIRRWMVDNEHDLSSLPNSLRDASRTF